MQKTIQAIVHPFYLQSLQGRNLDLYKKIIDDAVFDSSKFLYYIATIPDIRNKPNHPVLRDFDPRDDLELQGYLRGLPSSVRDRVALLADAEGEEAWHLHIYRPPGVEGLKMDYYREQSPLAWFSKNPPNTYYDSQLATSYTEITDTPGITVSRLLSSRTDIDRSLHEEGGRKFLQTPLHPQVAKLVRFLGTERYDTRIKNDHVLHIPKETTSSTRIIGSGEFLEACVFAETLGLATVLGIPMQNVSLNSEQPYLRDEARERVFYRRPVETLFPQISSAEILRPSYRR